MRVTLHTKDNMLKLGRPSLDEGQFPEFGPGRVYDKVPRDGVILQIGSRRWRVNVHMEYEDRYPMGGTVHFEETSEPETPFQPLEVREGYRPQGHFFGQPYFVQSPVGPEYNGEIVCLLQMIDSDWGDCGNENLFLALDENDIPVGLYHECSCA